MGPPLSAGEHTVPGAKQREILVEKSWAGGLALKRGPSGVIIWSLWIPLSCAHGGEQARATSGATGPNKGPPPFPLELPAPIVGRETMRSRGRERRSQAPNSGRCRGVRQYKELPNLSILPWEPGSPSYSGYDLGTQAFASGAPAA